MLSTPRAKGVLFLASSLCNGLKDNNIKQVATLLLSKDADPNILIPTYGVTPFHLVIGNDSNEFAEEVTKLFLRHGGDPNVRSNDGMTPVHVAAAWGRINILELLLANGGDPLCLDNNGRSPFHYAFDGKYFKAVTMLAKYCENIQDKDDKPKYNMALDKVLVTNGDIIAEYIASKDISSNISNSSKNNIVSGFDDCKLNTFSMMLESNYIPNISRADKIECELSDINIEFNIDMKKEIDKKEDVEKDINVKENTENMEKNISAKIDIKYQPSMVYDAVAAQKNNVSQTDNGDMLDYSFANLDFDFANLHLSNIIQKEKCLVSKIISHFSTISTSDCTINETLHNYKRNKQETSSSSAMSTSDMSLKLKKNYTYGCHKNPSFSSRLKCNNKDVLKLNTLIVRQYSKCKVQSASKRKYKRTSDMIPLTTCILDNSIISMSPNFNTFNYKKKSTVKTSPYIYDDHVITKLSDLTRLKYKNKKKSAKDSSPNNYLSSKTFKKSHEHKRQMQYSEFDRCKYVAQSTPRRKKKSIYKFQSNKKRFNFSRQEDDIIASEWNTLDILKPVNLDKTIFSEINENAICCNTLNSNPPEHLSLDFKKSPKIWQKDYCSNCMAIKLDEKRYDTINTIHNNDSHHSNLNNNFIEIKTENKSVNGFNKNKKYDVRPEENQINTSFITVRRNKSKIKKITEAMDPSTFCNMKATYKIDSNFSHSDNFINCIDCDIKKLLNEDLNMNISKTCNLHAKNWCGDKFHESLSHKSIARNNSCISNNLNLPIRYKEQIYMPNSQILCSSRLKQDANSNGEMFKTRNLDVCKIDKNSSLLSYVSTQEEYKYKDSEEGVILLERRLCVTPLSMFDESECKVKSKTAMSNISSASVTQSLPKELLFLDDATLRRELTQFGDRPGPITSTTRRVYLKRLMDLKNIKNIDVLSESSVPGNILKNYDEQNKFKSHLEYGDWVNYLDTYKSLEKQVFQEFVSPNPSRRWREGISKTSFTYLLLDPRITKDLPYRNIHLTQSEVWSIFLNAIFYIGKGKRSRPYAHLYSAFKIWVSKMSSNTSKKINHILDIWNNDHGVICLHVFQNIIPVEAYTREAAMIDAMGVECLENCKTGEYYGIAATWSMQQKQKFGRYLLYKALQIYLHEGEHQLFPLNL